MTHTYLEIQFINLGETLDPLVKEKVFDRYYRRKDTGDNFGIGLHLAKLIVEKDQGKIRVESEDGITRFIVRYFKSQII